MEPVCLCSQCANIARVLKESIYEWSQYANVASVLMELYEWLHVVRDWTCPLATSRCPDLKAAVSLRSEEQPCVMQALCKIEDELARTL